MQDDNMLLYLSHHTTTTKIYTLSLHDALPILVDVTAKAGLKFRNYFGGESSKKYILETTGSGARGFQDIFLATFTSEIRSEEHTSELQSQSNLVCRLLLEKKKEDHIMHDNM